VPAETRSNWTRAVMTAGVLCCLIDAALGAHGDRPAGIDTALADPATPPADMRGREKRPEILRFIDSLRATKRAVALKRERGDTGGPRTDGLEDARSGPASIARKKPSIDLEIFFGPGSAVLRAEALVQVNALGQALSSAELKGRTFLIAGHMDGLESDEYHGELSSLRATAVKNFLLEKFGLSSESLIVAGYGSRQPKNPMNPFATENRRVQIINLSDN